MQTRRVIKNLDLIGDWDPKDKNYGPYFEDEFGDNHLTATQCPYGKPGDKLWVRETWCVSPSFNKVPISMLRDERPMGVYASLQLNYKTYYELWDPWENTKWRPSIHMPRWASRITLEITDVRVERVQDINGDDVWAEGVDNGRANKKMGMRWENAQRMAFEKLWNSINEKRGYGWNINCWVWVIEFRRV
jgi:hypothetical protein